MGNGLVTLSIGNRFERIVQELLPELERVNRGRKIPDFHHPQLGFYAEAKAGYRRWGPKLHLYQRNSFPNLPEPVIYIAGFHALPDSTNKVTQRTERTRQNYLERCMTIPWVYFIDGEVVRNIWDREWKFPKNGKREEYCMLKMHIIRSILRQGTPFKRHDKVIPSAEQFYGFDGDGYLLVKAPTSSETSFGAILHKERDGVIIEYLKGKGILPK